MSEALLERTLVHLAALVGHDTQNPPRAIGTGGIFDYLQAQLPGFRHRLTDHGAGAISLLSVRGAPTILLNVHLDTVPAGPSWTRDPLQLLVSEDRAIGLGACDIKGAAAALLAAAQLAEGSCGLLFTTDEEANDPRCVAAFLKEEHPFRAVLVAEPSRVRAVAAHRGISSVRMRLAGRAGHASGENALGDSALHQMMRWGARALDYVEGQAGERFAGLSGLRFNVGRVEGGIKNNVIAPSAEVRFGFRPLPSMDVDQLLQRFAGLCDPPPAELEETFRGPPLPGGDPGLAEGRREAAEELAGRLGLPLGAAVDYWTEAALFSAAGLSALVYGPGDVAQAHTADEWVALEELQAYARSIARLLEGRGFDGRA